MSQQFLRRSKDRRLGLDPNRFRRTDAGDLSRLGLELNSFSVGRRTDVCDSSQIGLEPNSFAVGQRTYVWDSSRLGLESINNFGQFLCKEGPCITVLGTWELKLWTHLPLSKILCSVDWPQVALHPIYVYSSSSLDNKNEHCYCAYIKQRKKAIMINGSD